VPEQGQVKGAGREVNPGQASTVGSPGYPGSCHTTSTPMDVSVPDMA
jgi:hypothetical protein